MTFIVLDNYDDHSCFCLFVRFLTHLFTRNAVITISIWLLELSVILI